jgi:serine/threonine protein kinase
MDAVIGRGTYGVVSKCKNKDTGEVCAVKVIDKRKLGACTQTAAQVLCREVKLLLDLDHPHIIKLHDVYEDRTVRFFCVMMRKKYKPLKNAELIAVNFGRKPVWNCLTAGKGNRQADQGKFRSKYLFSKFTTSGA